MSPAAARAALPAVLPDTLHIWLQQHRLVRVELPGSAFTKAGFREWFFSAKLTRARYQSQGSLQNSGPICAAHGSLGQAHVAESCAEQPRTQLNMKHAGSTGLW